MTTWAVPSQTATMRIEKIETIQYRMPLKRPYGTSRGVTKGAVNFIVRLVGATHSGKVIGFGESQPRHRLTGDGRRSRDRGPAWEFLCAAVNSLADREISLVSPQDAVLGIRAVMDDLATLAEIHGAESGFEKPFRGTLLGVEVALLDAVARALGVKISALLGERREDVSISISTISTASDLGKLEATLARQAKFPMTRVKGTGELERDVELLRNVARMNSAAGRCKALWIDTNEGFDVEEAKGFIDQLAEDMSSGVLATDVVVEQPIKEEYGDLLPDLQRYADDVCSSLSPSSRFRIHIMADESVWDASDVRRLAALGGVGALNFKIPKAGGLLATLDAAEAALALDPDIKVGIGGMLGTSDLTAFALHNVGRAMPRLDYFTAVPPSNVRARIASPRAAYIKRGSNLIASQSDVGLGTRLDEEAIAPYVLKRFDTGKQASTHTLVFGGDTSLGDKHHLARGKQGKKRLLENPMYFFRGLAPLLTSKDHLILNFESVLEVDPVSPLEGRKNYLGWDTPDRTLSCLRKIGVTAVGMANNHAMDFGSGVMKETIARFQSAGIEVFGAGSDRSRAERPLTIPLRFGNQTRNVHILAVKAWERRLMEFDFFATDKTAGVALMNVERVSNQIRRLRTSDPNSYVIVYPHWNFDYRWTTPRLRDVARRFKEAGANLIIGHGTHMMSDFELDENGGIVWSVGNFQFNWAGRHARMPGAVPYSFVARLELSLENDVWEVGLRLYPTRCDNRAIAYQPRPVTEPEALEVVEILNKQVKQGDEGDQYAVQRDEWGWFIYQGALKNGDTSLASQPAVDETYLNALSNLAHKEVDSHLVATAVLERGLEVKRVSKTRFVMLAAEQEVPCVRSRFRFPGTSEAVQITSNKQVTRERFQSHGVPVAVGQEFSFDEVDDAIACAQDIGWPVVIKPTIGTGGVGVTAGVRNEEQLITAVQDIQKSKVARERNVARRFLLEKHIDGEELRCYVIGDQVASVILRTRARVIGDGVRTVQELMHEENGRRLKNPQLSKTRLRRKRSTTVELSRQGLDYNSIPQVGQIVHLSTVASISQGGEPTNIIGDVHPDILNIAVNAVKAIHGLEMSGVDLIVEDYRGAASSQNVVVLEANASPGILSAAFPLRGQPASIGKMIVDLAADRFNIGSDEFSNTSDEFQLRISFTKVNANRVREWFNNRAEEFGVIVRSLTVGRKAARVDLAGKPHLVSAFSSALFNANDLFETREVSVVARAVL